MAAGRRRAFLDSIFARLIALVIAVGCGFLLFLVYQDDAVVVASQSELGQSLAAECYNERAAQIDDMLAEGMISEEQAMLFKRREEARCATQARSGGAQGPTLPTEE